MSAKNLTLYISADLAEKMEELTEVNWSKIARAAIETYIKDRLETSIPSEALSRLRMEKGEEFANGKRYAVEEIVPKLTYKKLSKFFEEANERTNAAVSDYAAIRGIPDEMVNSTPYYEAQVLSSMKSFFGKLPQDTTEQFLKGALSVIEDTWNSLKE